MASSVKIPPETSDPAAHKEDPRYTLECAKKNAEKGNPDSLVKAIDEFCSKYARRTMNVGEAKGLIVDEIIKECSPTVAVELGAFMGYSAVRFARWLKPGSKYYSIEVNPEYAKLATDAVEFSGLSDRVELIVGGSESVIPSLREKYGIDKIDFVFIDHWKSLYKPDLIRFLECGLIQKGSVVVADNVIYPGAPDYLEYVRKSPLFESTFYESHLEYREDVLDGIEKSVYIG